MLCVLAPWSVVDFQQHFEINVELKGVMQDASVMHISNNVHQKPRTLHCGAVRVKPNEPSIHHSGSRQSNFDPHGTGLIFSLFIS